MSRILMQDDSDKDWIGVDDDLNQLKISRDERLKLDCPPGVSDFQRSHLERDAKKNWDLFYKRNGNRFFKKRYWTRREFSELLDVDPRKEVRYLLEIGCGCGDFALPLLDNEPEKYDNGSLDVNLPKDLFIYCCDISNEAIEILKSNEIYKRFETTRIHAFVGNVLDRDRVLSNLAARTMDYISLVFVLSAIDPSKMEQAIMNVSSMIRPDGLVFFRDYAIYDKAMMRFSERSKIADRFYVRQDGTLAYFFSKSEVINLFDKAGFICDKVEYVMRETVNVAASRHLSRIFLQAKFRKKTI